MIGELSHEHTSDCLGTIVRDLSVVTDSGVPGGHVVGMGLAMMRPRVDRRYF